MPSRRFCSPFVWGKARGEAGKANRRAVDENLFALRARKCLRKDGKCEQKRCRGRFVRTAGWKSPASKRKMRTEEQQMKICSYYMPGKACGGAEIARGEENANRSV